MWEKENAHDQYFFSILHHAFKKPSPKPQILGSSKFKEIADITFKFDENGEKFSDWVENTVGKGEIAHNEQFPLFPQNFRKTCTADR